MKYTLYYNRYNCIIYIYISIYRCSNFWELNHWVLTGNFHSLQWFKDTKKTSLAARSFKTLLPFTPPGNDGNILSYPQIMEVRKLLPSTQWGAEGWDGMGPIWPNTTPGLLGLPKWHPLAFSLPSGCFGYEPGDFFYMWKSTWGTCWTDGKKMTGVSKPHQFLITEIHFHQRWECRFIAFKRMGKICVSKGKARKSSPLQLNESR